MRVIKHPQGYARSIECIVGEIINLEAGSLLFKDGVRVPDSEIGPRNYPSVTGDSCEVRVRVSTGIIFANVLPIDVFMSHLQRVYLVMVKQLVGTKYENYHYEYYANTLTPHVRVSTKIPPDTPPTLKLVTYRSNDYYHGSKHDDRFIWYIADPTAFTFGPKQCDYKQNLCSVFYDHNNSLVLNHDTFIPMLDESHCVRSALRLNSYITLSSYWLPFIYQYKLTSWRPNNEVDYDPFPPRKTPHSSHHVKLKCTVYTYENSGIGAPDKPECTECKNIPVGPHYVLYDQNILKAITLCAGCLHLDCNKKKYLSSMSLMIFTKNSVLDPIEYLDTHEQDPIIKDVYIGALDYMSIGEFGVFIGGTSAVPKYYMVRSTSQYLLGGKVDPLHPDTKVIAGILV